MTARWTDTLLARARGVFVLLERGLQEPVANPPPSWPQRLLDNRDAIIRHIEQGRGDDLWRHEDPPSRRLPSRPGADRQGRRLYPRLRGRTAPQARGAAAARQPPARDVAGFIRSIDYAASAAIDRAPDLSAEDRATFTQRIRGWGERLTAAYWESYRETLGEAQLWPADEDQGARPARPLPA